MNTQQSPTIAIASTAEHKQQLSPRLSMEAAHDGKIWIYTFGKKTPQDQDSSRTVIDIWVDSVKRQTHALPPGSIWYRLSDFSKTDMNPSPYFIARLSELSKHRPDLKGYSAFVIPRNIFTQMILNLSRKVRPKHIEVRLFFDRDEALRWLASRLEA